MLIVIYLSLADCFYSVFYLYKLLFNSVTLKKLQCLLVCTVEKLQLNYKAALHNRLRWWWDGNA